MQDQVEPEDDAAAMAPLERIVRSLEEEIVLGRLRPRERLLEEELAKVYDAKRHVIRAALAELEAMGIVVRYPNRGAAVRDFAPEEVGQIYDLRELLERHAAEIMPLPAPPDVVAKLKELHARHSKAITDDTLLHRARDEHGKMIECLQPGNREKLVELIGGHIQPSKEAYLRLANSQWRSPFR